MCAASGRQTVRIISRLITALCTNAVDPGAIPRTTVVLLSTRVLLSLKLTCEAHSLFLPLLQPLAARAAGTLHRRGSARPPCLQKGRAPRTAVTLNRMQSGCRTAPYRPALLQTQKYGEAFASVSSQNLQPSRKVNRLQVPLGMRYKVVVV